MNPSKACVPDSQADAEPAGTSGSHGDTGSHGQNGSPRSELTAGRQDAVPITAGGPGTRRVLITGGAGFVGTNLAARLLSQGQRVLLLDNLSRPGVEANAQWLTKKYGSAVDVYEADVRDEQAVRKAVSAVSRVYHFAAQVAVTTSLDDPRTDFAVNAQGTLNVLEAARRCTSPPPLLFTSTNKVYGDLGRVQLSEQATRYEIADQRIGTSGVDESQPLDFHSPYGCSKGAADQYVLDYARSFRLPAVVFRMSCIYGRHQCGTEDQGWVAHFLLQALRGEPITIYGDGKQVRDVLFADDLVDALWLALDRIDVTHGRPFNIGGGPQRSVSLLELIELIEQVQSRPVDLKFEPWRPGDQRYYISDTRSFAAATGWAPRASVQEAVEELYGWLAAHRADHSVAAATEQRQSSPRTATETPSSAS